MKPPIASLLFYYANTPSGGGQTRVSACYSHFDSLAGGRKGTLIMKDNATARLPSTPSIDVQYLSVPLARRLFDENFYFKKPLPKGTAVFSHGAPVLPICDRYVLHLNTALPFVIGRVAMEPLVRVKMGALNRRLKRAANHADIVTVESLATRDLVVESWGHSFAAKIQILGNGVDPAPPTSEPPLHFPYAITIGTHRYKRLDMVLTAFRELKRSQPDLQLIIVDTHGAGRTHTPDPTITYYPPVAYSTVRRLIENAAVFISMSAVENSSISLLEAIAARRTIVCSDIPSHLESLNGAAYQIRPAGRDFVHASPPLDRLDRLVPDWREITAQTLATMTT